MSIPKMTKDLAVIQKLSDLPNATEGLTAEELKAKFDEAALEIQNYINTKLIPAILAANIPFTATSEIDADNVDAAIRSVQEQVKNASTGTIVNGSVTREKLSSALLARVYGGRPWVSMNTPGSAQNVEADFPVGQIWLRPPFTVVNAASETWVASGCTVTQGTNKFTVTGNRTVTTATITQAITGLGQDGDRVYVLLGIQNRDSRITALTVSLNSGEARDAAAGVFTGTLVGGSLTVQLSATWPSTSLAWGRFEVVNYAVVNIDRIMRQIAGAEEAADWAAYLRSLLPLTSHTSPEEVYIQTINGTWWPMGMTVLPASRGGTGHETVENGVLLCGGAGGDLEKLEPADTNHSFLQCVNGRPVWVDGSTAAQNTGIARVVRVSYTGNGQERTFTLPGNPIVLYLSSDSDDTQTVLQDTMIQKEYTDADGNKYYGRIRLRDNELRFWWSNFNPYHPATGAEAKYYNASGVEYEFVAIY